MILAAPATADVHCLKRESWDTALWASDGIKRGSEILVQSALLVEEMGSRHGPDSDLRSAFDDASRLFWLQYSLARHADELDRNMHLVGQLRVHRSGQGE